MSVIRCFVMNLLLVCVFSMIPTDVVANDKASHITVDMFPACRAKIGYVLVFRLEYAGPEILEVPEDLLPWSPGAVAMRMSMKSDLDLEIPSSGIIAERFGRITLQPNQELIGEIRLSLLFSREHINAVLSDGDIVLRWKYEPHLGGVDVLRAAGESRLFGKSFYSRCLEKGI